MRTSRRPRRFAVVGGGITGMVAAFRLRTRCEPGTSITVFESADRLGGKLHTLGGGTPELNAVDVGAEAFIVRRPELPALLRELGLDNLLVNPSPARPLIWSNGTTHTLPTSTLMGIPSSSESVRGLVDDEILAKIEREVSVPFEWDTRSDCSVAALVGARFGYQVLDRSVDPLLGGVYSGLSTSIGVRAALPTLAAALDSGAPSLTHAVREALPTPAPGPVFGGILGGYGVLLRALRTAASADVRQDYSVTSVRRFGSQLDSTQLDSVWTVSSIGVDGSVHIEDFDAVVLAVQAPELAALLRNAAPDASRAAARIDVASSVVVAFALPRDVKLPENSGILVSTDAGLAVKAFTLSSRKWPHLDGGQHQFVRASLGRFGDRAVLELRDAEIVDIARDDLRTVTGVDDDVVASYVQRWEGGLPQYAPGHLDVVAEIEHGVSTLDGLEVAGAWSHGVGVPACIASATNAAYRAAEVAR